MLISTMNDVPGYRVTSVLGEVFGLTVRSRNVGSQIGASFKSLAGGELKGMTKNLQASREEVVARMVAEAEARGGNAVLAMRFDTSEMGGNWTEICAYGTAVVGATRVNAPAVADTDGDTDADPEPDTDMVRACLRQPVSRTPVWFMRQAGRALPEYRAARGSGSILTAIGDGALAAELTLQPVRRYGVDAAILFSDIVVPVHAIGFGIDIEPGRGPVVAEPFRSAADLARLRPLEPTTDVPYVTDAVRLVARELAGSGVALIGFAGAPFTVASYLIEGGPSRTFTKVKSLMHGDPALWAELMDRLVAMSVAFLRAQIEAGVQAVQLFDSWAGWLSPDEYSRFVLPATRVVLEGIADLGVPTILFGVGTGELLGLMATAGADVIGVDWRVPLDVARVRVGPDHAVQGNLDPALCVGPWPVVEAASRQVLAAGAADGSGTGHIFNLGHGVLPEADIGILAAVVDLVHAESVDERWRGGLGAPVGVTAAGELAVGEGPVGVLVMAHGTPARREDIAPFYTRIRRGRPPSPEQLSELEARYAAIGGLSPLTERTLAQVDGVRAALERRAPGRYVVAYGAKHAAPLIEEAAAALRQAGVDRVIGLVLTPHGASLGSAEYLERADAALGGTRPFVAVPPWYAAPDLVALLATRVTDALASLGADGEVGGVGGEGGEGGEGDQRRYPVLFTAHSLPARVRYVGDTYPEQLEESARLVAKAAGLARWQVAWQSAGRTPEPWLGPDVRDVVRQLAEAGDVDGVVVCPIGFVTDHLEVLYDLDVELAAVAAEVGLPLARTPSLNDDGRFIAVLADVVMAADTGKGLNGRGSCGNRRRRHQRAGGGLGAERRSRRDGFRPRRHGRQRRTRRGDRVDVPARRRARQRQVRRSHRRYGSRWLPRTAPRSA